MEQNINAEKQARYRKKELLKRKADQILRTWQQQPWKQSRSSQDIHFLIEAAIRLPSGWTDEDYLNAEARLYHVKTEVDWPVDQIANDVRDSRNAFEEFGFSSDPSMFNAGLTKAIENTNALASHIISALKLSSCNEADQAAAIMEAMRYVGRSLAHDRAPCSQATAMCLSTISPIYGRPEWFYEVLAKAVSHQHPELAHKISEHLINNKYKNAMTQTG